MHRKLMEFQLLIKWSYWRWLLKGQFSFRTSLQNSINTKFIGFLPLVPKHELSKSALSNFWLSQGNIWLLGKKCLSLYVVLPDLSMSTDFEALPMQNVLGGTFMMGARSDWILDFWQVGATVISCVSGHCSLYGSFIQETQVIKHWVRIPD